MEAARRDTDPRRARYTIADAWDLIDKVGFMPVLRAVTESLVAVMTYSGEEQEPADPPA
jgi:hypothetical protein